MNADPDKLPDAECPLDLSSYDPGAVITRWLEAFRCANQKEPDDLLEYERGWFVFRSRHTEWIKSRSRRKEMAAMIWRLESRKPTSITQETKWTSPTR